MKILLVEAEFRMNRLPETDMTMLVVTFRNFTNAPEIILQIVTCKDTMFEI